MGMKLILDNSKSMCLYVGAAVSIQQKQSYELDTLVCWDLGQMGTYSYPPCQFSGPVHYDQSINEVVNPFCIILVKNGSKGDRLLFRYPYKSDREQLDKSDVTGAGGGSKLSSPKADGGHSHSSSGGFNTSSLSLTNRSFGGGSSNLSFQTMSTRGTTVGPSPIYSSSPLKSSTPRLRTTTTRRRHFSGSSLVDRIQLQPKSPNPYAVRGGNLDTSIATDYSESEVLRTRTTRDILGDLSDKDLSNLLSVNSELAERKFELKINEVRFVGHPTLMTFPISQGGSRPLNPSFQTSIKIFHIVFCVHAMASHSIVKCFYDLSKRLGIALRHENYRCGYMSSQMKSIISYLDEHACSSITNDGEVEETEIENYYFKRVFSEILKMSSLAQLMKKVYDDVVETGYVQLRVNNWIQVSFCLPQKIHYLPFRYPGTIVEPENIHRCLEAIRPYHALLLLVDREWLVNSYWLDAASTIPRLLQVYSPLKSLQAIAADADLTLSHVVEIASHLVYWSMATVIYPMCESNVYVIAPDSPLPSMELDEEFIQAFPGLSLTQTLGDFSLPMPLGERTNPIFGGSYLQAQVVHLVSWLLKNKLLIQLHTYVYLITYLDDEGIDYSSFSNGLNSSLLLQINEVRPYEHVGDEEDDTVTISDSFSETTGDEIDGKISHSHNTPTTTKAIEPIVTETSSAAVTEPATTTGVKGEDVTDNAPTKSSTGPAPAQPPPPEKVNLNELSDPVRRAIISIKSNLTPADINLFVRLSKYFTGEYHFEEIMYRENVRRANLLLLLDKFRDVIITTEKEDADINFFLKEQW